MSADTGGNVTDTDLLTGTQAAQLANTWRHIASGGRAATVGLTAISNWTARGHLKAAGLTPQGRKLYRTADLARAERATRSHALRLLARPEPEGADMPTRAKFRCNSAEEYSTGQRTYKFTAVTDDGTPENERYHRYTPSGALQISIDNPAVSFTIGAAYYLAFTPADEQPAATT